MQQRPDASGVPEADTTLSRDALDKVFAAEPVRSPNTLRKLCVLGIDPDISGAIAVMQWNVSPTVAKLELQDATIQIYDMPVTKVAIGKKLRRYIRHQTSNTSLFLKLSTAETVHCCFAKQILRFV